MNIAEEGRLSRHITLNCDYIGYLEISSSQELATCTAKICNIL